MNSLSRSPVGRFALVAVVGDRDAAHQFHDKEGAARLRRARIEHLRDVRMIHQRQRLPLLLEARDHVPRVHPQLDDLQRHPPLDGCLLLGHPHAAEATLADLFAQLVRPDVLARLLRKIRIGHTTAGNPEQPPGGRVPDWFGDFRQRWVWFHDGSDEGAWRLAADALSGQGQRPAPSVCGLRLQARSPRFQKVDG